MTLQITALYAAVIGVWAVILANYVSINRGKLQVLLGDGGKPELAAIIRRHANLLENVPLALILMGLAEASGLSATWMHILGVVLIISRLVHPFGITTAPKLNPLRVVGAVGTHAVTLVASLFILWTAISA